jgi:hypothetical protein
MNPDRRQLLGAALAASLLPCQPAAAARAERWAFGYFKNHDPDHPGLRLAVSADGLAFEPVRGGEPLMAPTVGENRLLRDPHILKDPKSPWFHMVWTTAWEGVTLGYARSRDLLNWEAQVAIPVMADVPDTRNVWAPETVFDTQSGEFVIFWSSTVRGRFSDAAGTSEDGYNHRIFCTRTRDFQNFTPAQLLFDPGYSVIDATFHRSGGKLRLIFKDERVKPERKWLQWCEAETPLGPFGPISQPFTRSWVEGPTAFQRGSETLVLFDSYRDNRFEAAATRDFKTWRDASAQVRLPAGASHGSVFPIDEGLYEALRRA